MKSKVIHVCMWEMCVKDLRYELLVGCTYDLLLQTVLGMHYSRPPRGDLLGCSKVCCWADLGGWLKKGYICVQNGGRVVVPQILNN